MLHLGTVSGKPSKGRCVSLLLVFHFCSFSKHKTNHSMFITCGFVHTFSWLFFLTAMIYNFIIFLCNNIFLVKWQGGTQADIVQVLPPKNKNYNDNNKNDDDDDDQNDKLNWCWTMKPVNIRFFYFWNINLLQGSNQTAVILISTKALLSLLVCPLTISPSQLSV